MEKEKYSLFIGRWQPLHKGHKKLIQKVLDEGRPVMVAIRNTSISEKNPYTVEERRKMLQNAFGGKIKIIVIPDIAEVCYGRNVGWGIRRIRLDRQIEEISGTKIRKSQRRIIWFTGNTGAGKTALAYLLKERLNGIVLDGDEMRQSISLGAGFSKADREEHNLRVARLAKVLHQQGHNIIVSVIAPFRDTRIKIDKICNPYWIYIKSGEKRKNRPYEVPRNPNLVIEPTKESLLQSVEKIIREMRKIK